MRIIGIDPGSLITGYGVVEKVGPKILHIDNGCLKINASYSIPERLRQIYLGVMEVLEKYKPDAVAIEEVFFSKNVMSLIRLGESRGVAILAAMQNQTPVHEYAAREVKQPITG